MKAATKFQSTDAEEIAAEYEFELKKLFYLAPAITEAAVIAVDGHRAGTYLSLPCCYF